MIAGSCCSDQSGLEQVKLGATIHLTFNELELGDLPFDLTVGPDRCADGGLIIGDTLGKGCDQAGAGLCDPRIEPGDILLADHDVEVVNDPTRLCSIGTPVLMAAIVTVSALLR
jgi:hypothetical protein